MPSRPILPYTLPDADRNPAVIKVAFWPWDRRYYVPVLRAEALVQAERAAAMCRAAGLN